MFGEKYSSGLQTNLYYLLKASMKIMLNNKIELKMKYLVGRSVWIEKFLNGQFKSEI